MQEESVTVRRGLQRMVKTRQAMKSISIQNLRLWNQAGCIHLPHYVLDQTKILCKRSWDKQLIWPVPSIRCGSDPLPRCSMLLKRFWGKGFFDIIGWGLRHEKINKMWRRAIVHIVTSYDICNAANPLYCK